MSANTKFKNSVFNLLFSDEQKLIEVYNALEGTNYSEDTEVVINTLENVLFMDRYNDISFVIDGKFVVLLEYQSTLNNNLPLRFLLYVSRVYEKMINNKNIYKEALIKIPKPEFYAFYCGSRDFPDEKVLKLSDAFIESDIAPDLDLQVRVININYGKSKEFLEKCKSIKDYSYFVSLVNKFKKQEQTLEEAIKMAIEKCIKEGILKEFLEANGSEVANMLMTEFNLEDAKEVWEEEAIKKTIIAFLDLLSDEEIVERTGFTLEEVQGLRKKD